MRWLPNVFVALAGLAGSDGPGTLPGAVISSIRGPYGYVAGPIPKGMAVKVTVVSNRIELFPDFAVVEQTLTLLNSAGKVAFWIGIDQTPLSTTRPTVRTSVPLAAAAWLDGAAVREDDVRIRDRALDDSGGYATGLRLSLEPGEHVLTFAVALQTVADVENGGVRHPAGAGPSHLAIELGLASAGFSLDDGHLPGTPAEAPEPQAPVRTVLLGSGTDVAALDPFAWTEGAVTRDDRIYWDGPIRLGLTYYAKRDEARAMTADELERLAKAVLARPPRGHLAIPPGAEPFARPGATEERRTEDAERARRALLVPVSGLFVIVLVLYFYFRRKERRR